MNRHDFTIEDDFDKIKARQMPSLNWTEIIQKDGINRKCVATNQIF